MGNRALIGALTRLVKDVPNLTAKINHVVFTAPDVDAQVFTDAMPYVLPAGRAFTLYASSRDRALNVAKSINGYRRAGEAGETILVIPPVSTIDASLLDTDLVGHSYYGDNRSVISDIFYLLKDVPASSRLLKERSKGDLVYWEFSA
jgi:esterase/lipase superfamily enzyme